MLTRSGRMVGDENPGKVGAVGAAGAQRKATVAAVPGATHGKEGAGPVRAFGVHLQNTGAARAGPAGKDEGAKKGKELGVVRAPAMVVQQQVANKTTTALTTAAAAGQPLRQGSGSSLPVASSSNVGVVGVVAAGVSEVEVLLLEDEEVDDDAVDAVVDARERQQALRAGGGVCDMSLEESMELDESQRLLLAELQLEEERAHEAMSGHARPSMTGVDNIDELDDADPQCVTEYVNDIYRFLRAKEARHALDAGYMHKCQTDINPSMRAILLDWLADVGLKFKLLNDSTHMTTMVLDRFLSCRQNVSRTQLQLVGVAAMLIACKYEEIYAPEVRDFEYICDNSYSRQEILDMEVAILNALNFDICHPTPIHFLRRFSKAARSDSECHTLSKYLLEVAAVHYESLRFLPSMLAAASVYLARVMHAPVDDPESAAADRQAADAHGVPRHPHLRPFWWSKTLRHYTGYSRQDIHPAVIALASWSREIALPHCRLNAVFRKYSKKFFGVANIPVPSEEALNLVNV